MPDDFNMEADANQQVPLQEQAPAGNPDQLANMERQQRKAYWKGEAEAQSRMTPFLPFDPFAQAMLSELEAVEMKNEEDLDALGMWIAEAEQRAAESRAFAKDHEMIPVLTNEQLDARNRERVIEAYGVENLNADYEANPNRVLAVPKAWDHMFTIADPTGRTPGGFSDIPTDQHGNELPLPPKTYYTPATHFRSIGGDPDDYDYEADDDE